MALPAINFTQRDFSAGQVTAAALRRDDLKLVRRGLREAENTRISATGGLANRFGRSARFLNGGRTEIVRLADTLKFYFTFTHQAVTIRNSNDEVIAEISGMPWTAATLGDIGICIEQRDVIVTYPGARPRRFHYGASFQPAAGIGTPIGDMTAGGGLAAGFDALTNTVDTNCARKTSATSAYIGLDISADPQRIAGVRVYGSNNAGYVSGGGAPPNVTLTLRGKTGSPPASPSDGTNLGNVTFADAADESTARSITSSDTLTSFDYVWVQIDQSGTAAPINCAEVQFQIFQVTPDVQWTTQPFTFAESVAGAPQQPYYRFAARNIAMLPSARTGAISINFDGPVLDPAHVGVVFRYHGRELIITGVTSTTAATANVIETLPPTMRVTCGSAAQRDSFQLGQVVIGQTTGSIGLVVAFNSTANLDVIVYKGDNFAASEAIISETGYATVSGTPSETTVAASTVWDEAAMSDYRGWPRSCFADRSRVGFCDFPLIPNGIAWSAIGLPDNFKVGTEANHGMFELVSGHARVLHVVGGADQFVITDIDVKYIPISAANPLAPGRVEFRPIEASGGSHVKPVMMHQGVVYVAGNGKSVMAIVPTGQTAFPYQVRNIGEYHADIINNVTSLAVMTTGGTTPEQYLWICNGDGTLAVGRFDRDNEWVGLVPHTGAGEVEWVAALGAEVLFDTGYELEASTVIVVEELDEAQFLDCAVVLNDPAAALEGDPGDGPLWFLAGEFVDLMLGRAYLGRREVDANGDLVEEPGDDWSDPAIVAGFKFELEVVPFLPNLDEGEGQGQRTRRRKVKQALATVQDSTEFVLMGRTHAAYESLNPGEDPPPLVSGTFRSRKLGRSHDPIVRLSKPVPGPLNLIELSGEVTV